MIPLLLALWIAAPAASLAVAATSADTIPIGLEPPMVPSSLAPPTTLAPPPQPTPLWRPEQIRNSAPKRTFWNRTMLSMAGGATASVIGGTMGALAFRGSDADAAALGGLVTAVLAYPVGCGYTAIVLDSTVERRSTFVGAVAGATMGMFLGVLLSGTAPLGVVGLFLLPPMGATFIAQTVPRQEFAVEPVAGPHGTAGLRLRVSLP